jgi:hypothetical protein
MQRRALFSTLATAAAGLGAVALTTAVSADADWCESDPPLRIVTPQGQRVLLHVTNYGQLTGRPADDRVIARLVSAAGIRHTVAADGDGTLVTVTVDVQSPPSGVPFATRSIVSTLPHGRGERLGAEMTGVSGQPLTTTFRLSVP